MWVTWEAGHTARYLRRKERRGAGDKERGAERGERREGRGEKRGEEEGSNERRRVCGGEKD